MYVLYVMCAKYVTDALGVIDEVCVCNAYVEVFLRKYCTTGKCV